MAGHKPVTVQKTTVFRRLTQGTPQASLRDAVPLLTSIRGLEIGLEVHGYRRAATLWLWSTVPPGTCDLRLSTPYGIRRTYRTSRSRLDTYCALQYIAGRVIASFADKETEKVWNRRFSRKLPADIQETALNKLRLLNAAVRLENMAVPPGNRLEALKGGRKGQHSIRINRQWRICFRWQDGNAHEVEIADYH